ALLPVTGQDVEQVVAVDHAPVRGHEHHPVAVAVEGDAQRRAGRLHPLHQRLRMGGANAIVDVEPVGFNADRVDLRTQLAQHQRADLVGGAVGTVHGDAHAVQ